MKKQLNINIQLIGLSFVHNKYNDTIKLCLAPSFRTDNLLFFKEKMNQLRKEIPGVQERFSKVCQMWADLSISQRNNYTEMCNAGKLKYQNELQHWFEVLFCFVLLSKCVRL